MPLARHVLLMTIMLLIHNPVQGREIRNVIDGNSWEWKTIHDSYYRAGIPTQCPDKSIPYDQSRKAIDINLACTSSNVNEIPRGPEPFDLETWLSLQAMGDLNEMHNFRAASSHPKWQGTLRYQTQIQWTWTERLEGQNGSECGWTYEKHLCTKSVPKTVCTPDPPSSNSWDGGGGGGGGGGSGSGGSFESSSSPWGFNVDQWLQYSKKLANNVHVDLSPISNAQAGCTTDWEEVEYDCYDQIANSCQWESQRRGAFYCSHEAVNYQVEFDRPKSEWRPKDHPDCGNNCDPNYHILIPNKYDLLPGEKEILEVSSGGGKSVRPNLVIQNPWNLYHIAYSPSIFKCQLNSQAQVQISIRTEGRILRNAPNALVTPEHQREALLFTEQLVNGLVRHGRPYEVHLRDSSSEMISASAEASRSRGAGSNGLEPFWKDTKFRIRLIEKAEGIGQRDLMLTKELIVDASQIASQGGELQFPLEGRAGVPNLYIPSGNPYLLSRLLASAGSGDIELTPGKKYELRIAMYQRGIPFYISGCNDGHASCENEEANAEAFSEDLVLDFTAAPDVDNRTLFEKLLSWQRRWVR